MITVSFFKALADETRLRLVNILLHYELNVNEIMLIMKMGQSRISRHLKLLLDSRLLICRRDGLWSFYSAQREGEGSDFLRSIAYLFDTDSIFMSDLKEAQNIIKQRTMTTMQFFDAIADDWPKLKEEMIGSVDLNQLIIDWLPPTDIIVDVGCGNGDLLPLLRSKASRVIGVDRSAKMLIQARQRFSHESSGVDIRMGEVEHLPLRDEEADAAIINMVLHHLSSPLAAFKEIYRVLKINGFFIVIDLCSHNQEKMRFKYGDRWLGFQEQDIRLWFQQSQFTIEDQKYFPLKNELKGFIIKVKKTS